MIIATPSAITVMFTGTWVTTEMTSAVAKSRMPSASVRVITKMIAATFLTSGPKRRSSSSYDVYSSPRKYAGRNSTLTRRRPTT